MPSIKILPIFLVVIVMAVAAKARVIVIRMDARVFRECITNDTLQEHISSLLDSLNVQIDSGFKLDQIYAAKAFTRKITYRDKSEKTSTYEEKKYKSVHYGKQSGSLVNPPDDYAEAGTKTNSATTLEALYYRRYEFSSLSCLQKYIENSEIASECISWPNVKKPLNSSYCTAVELTIGSPSAGYDLARPITVGEEPESIIEVKAKLGISFERVLVKPTKKISMEVSPLGQNLMLMDGKEAANWYRGWSLSIIIDKLRRNYLCFAFSYLSSGDLGSRYPFPNTLDRQVFLKKISIYQFGTTGLWNINLIDEPKMNIAFLLGSGLQVGWYKGTPTGRIDYTPPSNGFFGPSISVGSKISLDPIVIHGLVEYRLYGDNSAYQISLGIGLARSTNTL